MKPRDQAFLNALADVVTALESCTDKEALYKARAAVGRMNTLYFYVEPKVEEEEPADSVDRPTEFFDSQANYRF